MASAQYYINIIDYSLVTGGNINLTYATGDFDGEIRNFYINYGLPYDESTTVIMDSNIGGPEKIVGLPGGISFYYDVGSLVYGTNGEDTLVGYTLEDWLVGRNGDDVLKGMGEADILHGELGNDTLFGGDDDDWLYGGGNNDLVYGDAGDDWMHGGDGDDWLNGGAGVDTMAGGAGNDGYLLDSTADTITEEANGGIDTVTVKRSAYALGANIENATAHASIVSPVALTGNTLANTLIGAGGGDNLRGFAGADLLNGGNGNDWIYGGTENDTLFGEAGNDNLLGEDGVDYLDGGTGTDTMAGGQGNDTYVVETLTDVLVEGLNAGTDTVHSLLASTTLGANFENLTMLFAGNAEGIGNAVANRITGTVWNDMIDGLAGNDLINSGFGNDTVRGGDGDDTLRGETGLDWVYGDEGNDRIEAGDGVDYAYGGAGVDRVLGGIGGDVLYGGLDADFVYGGADGDWLYGDAGNDQIWGEAGNDFVNGGDGNDDLRGGEGNDQIRGGLGADVLYGEAGADRFVFAATPESQQTGFDRIMDFSARAGDRIDLSMIDADTTLAGNQAFYYAGAPTVFSGAGDLYTTGSVGGTVVQGDLNGDGLMDFTILVAGTYAMTASDFIL